MLNAPIAITGAEFRPLEPDHAEMIFSVVDAERDRLGKWLPWVEHTTHVDDTRAFIASQQEKYAAGMEFAAEIWYCGQFAGVLGMILNSKNHSAEIGYWIRDRFEGLGLITESTRAATSFLFSEHPVTQVEIHCAEENRLSWAVPKRLGFRHIRTDPQSQAVAGRTLDHRVYTVTRTEWLSAATSRHLPQSPDR